MEHSECEMAKAEMAGVNAQASCLCLQLAGQMRECIS